MTTQKNAMDAFAGESQANRKYLAFSEKAAADGFKNVATLFKAASEKARGDPRKETLKSTSGPSIPPRRTSEGSIEGETHEYYFHVPAFVKEAEAEKKSDAVLAFTLAMKAEAVHADLYKKALAALNAGHDLGRESIFLCPVCGNIEIGKAPDKCPICGVFGKQFHEITL